MLSFTKKLLVFGLFCYFAQFPQLSFSLSIRITGEELINRSNVIAVVEVERQTSQYQDDFRGKHIYTIVNLKTLDILFGDEVPSATPSLIIKIVGGTVDGVTEVVSSSPSFKDGEKCLLFLQSNPWRIVGGRQGKRSIYNEMFFVDGYRITPNMFSEVIKVYKSDIPQRTTLKTIFEKMGANIVYPPIKELKTSKDKPESTPIEEITSGRSSLGAPIDLGGGQCSPSEIRRVDKKEPKQ